MHHQFGSTILGVSSALSGTRLSNEDDEAESLPEQKPKCDSPADEAPFSDWGQYPHH